MVNLNTCLSTRNTLSPLHPNLYQTKFNGAQDRGRMCTQDNSTTEEIISEGDMIRKNVLLQFSHVIHFGNRVEALKNDSPQNVL